MHFILPKFTDFLSGGNTYNQELVSALRRLGEEVHCLDWKAWEKQRTGEERGWYIFDSLYLDKMRNDNFCIGKNTKQLMIVHHLPSLWPGDGMDAQAHFHKNEQGVLEQMDALLMSSEFTRKYLTDRELLIKMLVAEPALSFRPIPKIQRKNTESIRTLMVANLLPRKGILHFLKILNNELTEEKYINKHWNLKIIGEKNMNPAYTKACENLLQNSPKLREHLSLEGPANTTDLAEIYASSDLFISTSKMETFGMALHEARACGLPILALRGGNAAAHLTDGQTGFLFYKMEDLSNKYIEIINNKNIIISLEINYSNDNYSWNSVAQCFRKFINSI